MNMTLDLTMNGSLFALWDHMRFGNVQAACLLNRWMLEVGGDETPFEETAYLSKWIQKAATQHALKLLDKAQC